MNLPSCPASGADGPYEPRAPSSWILAPSRMSGVERSSFRSPALTALTLIGVLLATVGAPGSPTRSTQVLAWAVMAAIVSAAMFVRRRDRRAYERALAVESARLAVAEDRLATARQLHDRLSGSLGAITVRAAVARRLETDADGMHRALTDIEEASREATDQLRRAVTALRSQGTGSGGGPGAGNEEGCVGAGEATEEAMLADAERARRLGLTVAVEAEVPLASLRPEQAEAVRAVVREGLANAAHHAGPTGVRVQVLRERRALPTAGFMRVIRVRVCDRGPVEGWRPRPGTGNGLRSLSEWLVCRGARLSARALHLGFELVCEIPDEVSNQIPHGNLPPAPSAPERPGRAVESAERIGR